MGRRSPGDNKRHCFVIILDRSASMASSNQEKSPVERAEKGVIQAALALERCGIDICIIDFYRTSVRVLNPFGQPISEAKHRLTTAEAAGLTPLGKALSVAKSQLKTVRGPGHIIAMTDDDPTDRSRFEAESETCRYPIHGGLITMAGAGTTNTRTPNELYDTHVSITGSDDLSNKLLHLAERLALR
jgi:Mg-chelatase subunit ChlD